MDEFRDTLRRLIDEEVMETHVQVTIVRSRRGRNGDARLPVTNVSETFRHPDAQHMESFNAHLETWVARLPVPENLLVEVFAEAEQVVAEKALGTNFFRVLDQQPPDEAPLHDTPAPTPQPTRVGRAEPELEIPAFVHQPHPEPAPARRRAS